jgi:hypothetical protein
MPVDPSATDQALFHRIDEVVSLLVRGKYDELQWLTQGIRLNAASLQNAIEDYGRTLVLPPANSPPPKIGRVNQPGQPRWWAVVPLFTAEEGLSDLSLELTLTRHTSGRLQVEIDDLHVL